MNLFCRLAPLFLSIILFSCKKESQEPELKKDIKVLIVGNSILRHGPAASIGWYGDWGMAASSPDKDFLHLYNKLLQESDRYKYVDINSKNIAAWESDFNYGLMDLVDITSKNYDILIVRLGENVGNKDKYKLALNDMIRLFKTSETKVIITGIIWDNGAIDAINKEVAVENGYKFIPFDTFRSNEKNYAFGLFQNPGVAAHPSDLGMSAIAQLLFNSTIEAF